MACFFCTAVPRFIGCFDAATPCIDDEVKHFNEGESIRFNISVGYIPGGPSGMEQDVRLVSLRADSLLVNCLNSDLGSCIVNPTLPSDVQERLTFSRDASDPWFDIEINITNAVPSDSDVYQMVLEADDLSAPGVVTQSTSLVTVSVTPTPTVSATPTSSKPLFFGI